MADGRSDAVVPLRSEPEREATLTGRLVAWRILPVNESKQNVLHIVGDTKILKIGVVKRERSRAKAKKRRTEKRRKSGRGVP